MTEVLDETPETEEPTEEPVEPDATPGLEPDEEEAEEKAAPEPKQSEPSGLTPEQIAKRDKALDAEAVRHAKRLSEIMGKAALDLVMCELCDVQTPGFHLPVSVLQPETEVEARLLEVLKTPAEPELKDDPFTRTCETCGGKGKTKTRGDVPGHMTRGCPTCKGQGYLAFDENGAQVVTGPVTNGEVIVEHDQPLESGEIDIWGSPRLLDSGFENPNYGRMPQYKLPQYP